MKPGVRLARVTSDPTKGTCELKGELDEFPSAPPPEWDVLDNLPPYSLLMAPPEEQGAGVVVLGVHLSPPSLTEGEVLQKQRLGKSVRGNIIGKSTTWGR